LLYPKNLLSDLSSIYFLTHNTKRLFVYSIQQKFHVALLYNHIADDIMYVSLYINISFNQNNKVFTTKNVDFFIITPHPRKL